jgi:hypothetical protein
MNTVGWSSTGRILPSVGTRNPVRLAGIELVSVKGSQNNQLRQSPDPRAAKSGAVGALELPLDPDLGVVIELWAELPEMTRQAVLAMMREAERSALARRPMGPPGRAEI